ncbi:MULTISPECIES: helix-turn-helix domain-containing protein [unclassified Sporosarcina]|uniref:helix-turn-helix domain-containing protein n=1 Tax=unclassified Sporosarcina TaxID=2647733 RepID=UPI00203B6302|nr:MULTISPECIES: helix-turn-helix domain-containing protein [unclassified Sporosarcina]GKV66733.1 hypothetical protein NCCP2331_28860 [Sporosarcina sp. NCCP-2331]GLB57084.1 hypothetical protein NCCP2378_28710 [Sporosarcina sp. NCCP-2378]
MHELLDVSEVARRLKCNKNTVYDLIRSGRLVGLKLGRMKVSTMELNDFMKRYAGKDVSDPHRITNLPGDIEILNERKEAQ